MQYQPIRVLPSINTTEPTMVSAGYSKSTPMTRWDLKSFPTRKIISFVSRCCVKAFYGRATIWDVNTPYRLMRTDAFHDIFKQIPLTTFAPNLILSGMVARRHLRFFETRVPQHDRTTGEVSIKKWKLFKAAARSFAQTISFALFRN